MTAPRTMEELRRYSVNLGELPATLRHERRTLGQVFEDTMDQAIVPSVPTMGDVKAQPVRLADVLVFGPLMIYSGMGKNPPKWVKAGLIVIGVGTILYNLQNYLLVQQRKQMQLGQMQSGPWHRIADLERVQRLSPGAYRKRRPGGL